MRTIFENYFHGIFILIFFKTSDYISNFKLKNNLSFNPEFKTNGFYEFRINKKFLGFLKHKT